MQYVNSLLDLIGNTPLLRLSKSMGSLDGATGPIVLAKVEYLNPGGSVKDRIATRMIEAAEASGELQPGGTIVEPTSGNTGVGLAMVAQAKGYKCIFVCPDKVSEDKRNVLKAYGAEVVVCPTAVEPEHPDSYYNVSDRLASQPGAWKPDQYSNPHNPRSHYETTGPEIWAQTEGRITHFVAGVGTGGTISGTGRYLKEQNPDVQVVGADPAGSVYSGGSGRPYLVEGVGEDFWPDAYDRDVADRIIEVSDADSFAMTRRLAREEALLVGGSSGMAAYAAIQLAHELEGTPEGEDAVIVVLLPGLRPRLPHQGLQRRLAGAVRLPRRGRRAARADRRRGAARQGRAAARPGAHPPRRDHRRGGRDPAGVRRLADAGRPRRAARGGRRGRRLGLRADPARPALHRRRPAHRQRQRAHVAAAAHASAPPSRPPRPSARSRAPTRCSCTRTASRSASSPATTCWPTWPAAEPRVRRPRSARWFTADRTRYARL